jgi:hypothetical protein
MQDEIDKIKGEIAKSQQDYNVASRAFKNQTRLNELSNTPQSGGSFASGGNRNTSFSYPKNLPVKTANGDYYYPEGSELSSKKGKEAGGAGKVAGANGVSGGAPGAAGGSAGAAGKGGAASGGEGVGGVDMNALAGIGGDLAMTAPGRGPASVEETVDDIKKRMKLSAFEYHKYIPHAIFDVVGAVDKVVILLGLEGKSFKTIEAQEVVDKVTQKLVVKYTQRTYDFVPEGEFEEFKEFFVNKDEREKAFLAYFNYPRNKDNLVVSKKYAKATKEISKESLTHNYVLSIQNDIMSEDEIRKTIHGAMELLK